jgi:hypothetical protein
MRKTRRSWLGIVGATLVAGCGAPMAAPPDDAGTTSTADLLAVRRTLRAMDPLSPVGAVREQVARAFTVPTPIAPMVDRSGRYLMHRRDSTTFFTDTGFAWSLAGGFGVHCTMIGAHEGTLIAERQAAARVHRYSGASLSTDAPTYERLAWEEIYPGIDMVAEPSRGGVRYRFVASPGAKVSDVVMHWQGATAVRVVDDGRGLDVETGIGALRVRGLRVFAIAGEQRTELPARHVLEGDDRVAIAVDGWDGRTPLIIDPAIAWSSYLGGASPESGAAVAVDAAGNAYVTGYTESGDFPKPGAFDSTLAGTSDAFVTKISGSGAIVWSSYLGGSASDRGTAIAVDGSGNAYVTGFTQSSNFPTTGGFDTSLGAVQDGFVAKITTSGTLAWSSFLGGADISPEDRGHAIAVDASGNVFVAGRTVASDFPSTGGFDTSYNGDYDAFVTKISTTGALQWSTFLGGTLDDVANGIAVDGSGDVIVVGQSVSSNFPLKNAFDTTVAGNDAFVTKLTNAGALVWSSFLGGSAADYGNGVAVDASGNVFVAGTTYSNNLPGAAGFDAIFGGGGTDGFVAKVTSAGVLSWSSYIGGSAADGAASVAVDSGGNVIVTGQTSSIDFNATGGFDTILSGTQDAFLIQATSAGAFVWGSYLGGTAVDQGLGIAIGGAGNAVITGLTSSPDFPTTGGFDTSVGGTDAFVLKLGGGRANGVGCAYGYDCASSFCADGVCCNTACTGACQACVTAKKGSGANGVCGSIADGSDPDKECATQSCATAIVTNAQVCNGAGACRANGTSSCGLFACNGAACATSCTSDADCFGSAHCAGSTCVADLDAGAACARASQCKSGFCTDAVCCDKACTGDCEACTAAKKGSGTDGTCAPVAADTDPKDRCGADPTPLSCAADGMCDGAGACHTYAKKGTPCGATTCTSGAVSGKTCNGAGTCDTATTPCALYSCGTGACRASCTADADCVVDAYCTSSGACVPKQRVGQACTESRQCEKGFCVDGTCCESACTGQCEACGESGSEGRCTPVTGAPRGKRTACVGDAAVCGGTCDGTNPVACKYAPTTKSCGSSCAAGRETESSCDGLGLCAVGKPRDCSPLICADDMSCATTCVTDGQCAAGFRCSAGACVPSLGRCSDDGLSVTADGVTTTCKPARCRAGRCIETCSTTADCAPEFICNSSNNKCEAAPTSSTDDAGGCATGAGKRSTGAWLVLSLVLVLLRRRRV